MSNVTGWADQDKVHDIKSELLEINMGPQHPATHGVLRLLVKTDGEIVDSVSAHIGYLHRCAEKIAEGNDYRQFMVYTDRFDYLAPMNMNFSWAVAVENMLEIEVPERAEYIRVICAELQRICSHAERFRPAIADCIWNLWSGHWGMDTVAICLPRT